MYVYMCAYLLLVNNYNDCSKETTSHTLAERNGLGWKF